MSAQITGLAINTPKDVFAKPFGWKTSFDIIWETERVIAVNF